MFVIEVIPLKRAVHVESLSYYSSIPYEAGTMLTVPVCNSEVHAVVVNASPVSTAKAALKAATFSLKKLPPQEDAPTLSPALIAAANDLAEYYACQNGAALYQLLLPEVRDGSQPLPHTHHVPAPLAREPEVFQGTFEERYLAYTSLARETLAHGESILLVVPSPVEADIARQRLGFGIEERMVVFSSAEGAAAKRKAYAGLEDFSKPKLIIATPPYSVLERHDISTIIIEGESSANYRTRTRPYFDYRVVLRMHARRTGRRCIFGDLLIRTEEECARREERYGTYEDARERLALSGKLVVVRMKEKPDGDIPFKLFSPKVLEAIEETHRAKRRTFLFSARKGLAPVVACADCGYIFRSPDSGAPYSLVRTVKDGKESRWFVCSVSGHKERAADVCAQCGSWRLRGRGIGIQHAHDELAKALPGIPLIVFEHTNANTYKKASFLRKRFYETKGAVMLGTQMALPYLNLPIDTSVVLSMDALRATPTWHQEEMTLSVLLALRERTDGNVFVQLRTSDADDKDPFIEYARSGALQRFYDEEIELRRQFRYPPFAHFVHLTWQGGASETAARTEALVREALDGIDAQYYAAPPSAKDVPVKYALIRLPATSWPDQKLSAALRSLPPSVRIVMNPDRII